MKALTLAAALAAAQSLTFDGAAPARVLLPPPPSAPVGRPVPSPVPDFSSARARFGHEAMIAALPARGAAEPFSFAVIGDAEPGRFAWERVFNPGADAFDRLWRAAQDRGPDFVLQLGDFVSEGDEAHYRAHVRQLERGLRQPLLRTIGNHDRSRPNGPADKTLYEASFGARDYKFDHGGWRFVSVDSSDRELKPAQLAWLRQALAGPGPKVVFTHVPPAYIWGASELAGGPAASPTPALDGYLEDFFTAYFVDGAAEFREIVEGSGVQVVLAGHVHAFFAADVGGVRYVISGGGGSPLYPLPSGYPSRRFAHALWAEAGPAGLSLTVQPLSGAPWRLP